MHDSQPLSSDSPPWVPNFYGPSHNRRRTMLRLQGTKDGHPMYNATHESTIPCPYRYVAVRVVKLSGFRVGSVASVAVTSCLGHSTAPTDRLFLTSTLEIYASLPLLVRDRRTRTEALWRTIVGDVDFDIRPASTDTEPYIHTAVLTRSATSES
jgi:hypothetical protein